MRILLSCILAAAIVALACTSVADAAPSGPYEPNDTIQSAFGPITANQVYRGRVEIANDPDWYYLVTDAAGVVDIAVSLTECQPTAPGATTCSNLQATAYDTEGGILGRAIANTPFQALHLTFPVAAPSRISFEVRSAVQGSAYSFATSFPSPAVAPPAPPAPTPPPIIDRFQAQFAAGWTRTRKAFRNWRVTGLTVTGVAPGSVIIIRCTTGCKQRYRKWVTARTTQRKFGGFPLPIKKGARFRIEVRRSGYVGRFVDVAFPTRGRPTPRVKRRGCMSPYNFEPILCAS